MNRSIALILCIVALNISIAFAMAQDRREKPAEISEIHLERTWCYGKCPIDKVILRSDGTASYIGKRNVERIGQYKGLFSEKHFSRLAAFLQAQQFFQLKAEYHPDIEDAPGRITTVIGPGSIKTVSVLGDDKPTQLWNIETAILGVAAEIAWAKDDSGIRGEAKAGPRLTSIPLGPFNNSPVPHAIIVVQRASDGREITRQQADGSGRFQIPLPAGTYLLSPLPGDRSRSLPRGKPQTITIKHNVLTEVVLEYDTGLRYTPKEK